jgi:DNA topoisomerase IA
MHDNKDEPFIPVICEKPHAARKIAQALGTNNFKRSISSAGVPFFYAVSNNNNNNNHFIIFSSIATYTAWWMS